MMKGESISFHPHENMFEVQLYRVSTAVAAYLKLHYHRTAGYIRRQAMGKPTTAFVAHESLYCYLTILSNTENHFYLELN